MFASITGCTTENDTGNIGMNGDNYEMDVNESAGQNKTAAASEQSSTSDFDADKYESYNFTLVRHIPEDELRNLLYPDYPNTASIITQDCYDIAYPDIDYLSVFGNAITTADDTGTIPVSADAIVINDNKPLFSLDFLDMLVDDNADYEYYSELDGMGRCGTAYAVICKNIMPTEKRGEIGSVKPTGWQTAKYDKSIISDMYLYNRCHLIGYQLAGENANDKNLITGTRFMNVVGMLPFENQVSDYVKNNPDNHVLYQVTPVFGNDNLVAYGVIMSGLSCEDYGAGVSFCVFCPNVQPMIKIDYATGDNKQEGDNWYIGDVPSFIHDGEMEQPEEISEYTQNQYAIDAADCDYVLNESSKKYHHPNCEAAAKISENNRRFYNGSTSDLESQGYEACKICIKKTNERRNIE